MTTTNKSVGAMKISVAVTQTPIWALKSRQASEIHPKLICPVTNEAMPLGAALPGAAGLGAGTLMVFIPLEHAAAAAKHPPAQDQKMASQHLHQAGSRPGKQ